MAKQKKAPRPKAETPKGFRDYFGPEVAERDAMLAKIAEVYHRYGFDALESSAVETLDALGKYLPDVDRPNEGVFAWQEDGDGDWLALRYDLTAPLARVYAQHRQDLPTPYRRYAMGPVWRNEKPGPGRFRQFYQCDADTVGTPTVAADAEICAMLADTLEAVGIERGDYIIRVFNRKVMNGLLEEAGLTDGFERERGIVLRAIDKLDRLGAGGIRDLLGKGRRDESGDFTEGACLDESQIQKIMYFLNVEAAISDTTSKKVSDRPTRFEIESDSFEPSRAGENPNFDTLNRMKSWFQYSQAGSEGVRELYNIAKLCFETGYNSDRIVIDPSVVRGLGYYTGTVFEAELTFEITDDKGRPRQFGSVAGGGRYDDLVKRFTGQAVPATGISIGVDRLLAALRAKGRMQSEAQGPVLVTVMDRDRMADYQQMAAELRNPDDGGKPIRAEVYLGNPKNFGNQLKYADRRDCPLAVIEGGDEKARGVVTVKDLVLGKKLAAEIESNEEWKAQPAQEEIPRGDLVPYVRKKLGA